MRVVPEQVTLKQYFRNRGCGLGRHAGAGQ
jgi:hypothetical protein